MTPQIFFLSLQNSAKSLIFLITASHNCTDSRQNPDLLNVPDRQHIGVHKNHLVQADFAMARKSSALREAPPISPPSISSIASRSRALSGFMLPP